MNKQRNRIERHVTFIVLLLLLSMLLSACGGDKYICGLCQQEYTGTPKDYSGMKLCNQCHGEITKFLGEAETVATTVADNTVAPMESKIFSGQIVDAYPFVNGYAVIGGYDKYGSYGPTSDYCKRLIDTNGNVINLSGIKNRIIVFPPDNERILVGSTLYDINGTLIHEFDNAIRIGVPSDGMMFVQEKVKKISGDTYDLVYYNTDGIEEFRFTDGTEPLGTPSDMRSGIAFVVNNDIYSLVTKEGDVKELIADTAENRQLAKDWINVYNNEELVGIDKITVEYVSGGRGGEKYFGCRTEIAYTVKWYSHSSEKTRMVPGYITDDGIVHIIPATGFDTEAMTWPQISQCVNSCVIINNQYIYNISTDTLYNVLQSDICQAAGVKPLSIVFIDDGNYMVTISQKMEIDGVLSLLQTG